MHKIKIPETIKIGSHRYKIMLDISKRLDDEGVYGEINHRLQRILIRKDRPDSRKREALVHEIIHCIDKVYSIDHLEEAVVGSLAEGLSQALDELGIDFNWTGVEVNKEK